MVFLISLYAYYFSTYTNYLNTTTSFREINYFLVGLMVDDKPPTIWD